jgi:hypothetical protein
MGYVGKQKKLLISTLSNDRVFAASGITGTVLVAQFTPAKLSLLSTINKLIQGAGVASLV